MVPPRSKDAQLQALTRDLMGLRPRNGITLERVKSAAALLSLRAVRYESTVSGTESEPEISAFALLQCVLGEDSRVLPAKVRALVAHEINIEGSATTYSQRKEDLIVKLNLYGTDYDRHSRNQYEKCAITLMALSQSPCLDASSEAERKDEIKARYEDFATQAATRALQELAWIVGNEAAREIASTVLDMIPGAIVALRNEFSGSVEHELDPLQVIILVFERVRNAWSALWPTRAEREMMSQHSRESVGTLFQAALVTPGEPRYRVPPVETGASALPLAATLLSIEARGAWASVFAGVHVEALNEAFGLNEDKTSRETDETSARARDLEARRAARRARKLGRSD